MNQLPDTEQFPQVDISSTFGLHPDMTVEVLTMENRLTLVGKVETVRNGAVVLREAKGDSLPPVMYNREIKLRYFQGERGSVVVNARVCGSTNLIWKVDRLESKYNQEQRAFFRQSISLDITARCARRCVPAGPGSMGLPKRRRPARSWT